MSASNLKQLKTNQSYLISTSNAFARRIYSDKLRGQIIKRRKNSSHSKTLNFPIPLAINEDTTAKSTNVLPRNYNKCFKSDCKSNSRVQLTQKKRNITSFKAPFEAKIESIDINDLSVTMTERSFILKLDKMIGKTENSKSKAILHSNSKYQSISRFEHKCKEKNYLQSITKPPKKQYVKHSLNRIKSDNIQLECKMDPNKASNNDDIKIKNLEAKLRKLEREGLELGKKCEEEKSTRIYALKACYRDKKRWQREKFVLLLLTMKL